MNGVAAHAIFCEDIREEVTGGYTIVGAMRDNIGVPSFPGALPKLGIFIRMYFPLDEPANWVRLYMAMSSGERTLIGSLSPESIDESIQAARADDAPEAGMIANILAAPFHLAQPVRVSIELEYDGQVSVVGWLNFKEGVSPAP
jgi:hypothetical protein